ncbi:MAG: hypothetical protein SNG38_07560 [Rikenellaceae bacterium]
MKRLIIVAVALFSLTACFLETSYQTTYIIRPYSQEESGGDNSPLEGVLAYAFEGSSDEWEVDSYLDALTGVLTSSVTGERRVAFAWGESYDGSESYISMTLDREETIIVVVDPASEIYAYTDYTVPYNFSEVFVDLVFYSWKSANYTSSKWTFVVPEVEEDDEEESDENDDGETTADEGETTTDEGETTTAEITE